MIAEPSRDLVQRATQGELAALDELLRLVQPGIFALALRFLGQREDAADATQEVLLKLTTHLGGFRGEARFSTWAWRIAHHHLLAAATRAQEAPTVSLEAMGERLDAGLAFHAQQGERALTPEDKLEARQVALSCTQQMLMCLDREQRMAYAVSLVLDLDSEEAGEVLGMSAAAYRQRLSRAKARLDAFTHQRCGLANPAAPCRCEKQLPALAVVRGPNSAHKLRAQGQAELAQAELRLDALAALSDSAALLRAHPDYAARPDWLAAIRVVLERSELRH